MISSKREGLKQEDSMSHFKMFTGLNEYQDLGQLSYNKYLANCLKGQSFSAI